MADVQELWKHVSNLNMIFKCLINPYFRRDQKSGCKTDTSNATKCYCSEDYCNSADALARTLSMITISVAIFIFM